MHKFLFYNKFMKCLYMFRAICAHHQEVKIVHRLSEDFINLCTGRPPTGVIISDTVKYNFDLLIMMTTWCSKHVEAYKKLIIKQ